MLRHLLFAVGIGFLVVIAAVLYAQDRQMQAAKAPILEEDRQAAQPEAQADPPRYRRSSGWGGRMLERVREQLQLSDEEWVVLRPKIEPVVETQRELRRGSGSWGRFGDDDNAESPIARAADDLRATLANPDATTAELSAKVEALRAARDEVEAELAAAQQELLKALAEHEAATLVLMGVLE